MATNTLLIKNMVCNRCLLVVERTLQACDITYDTVRIGEVHLNYEPPAEKLSLFASRLSAVGLQLVDKKNNNIIEKIKQLVSSKARKESIDEQCDNNLSDYLSRNLYHEYTYLSRLFSAAEGRTIENYLIEQRIEKVKELLVFKNMTLSDISLEMDYSSTAHLSRQFKQVTGLTPSHFKRTDTLSRNVTGQTYPKIV